MAQPTIEGVGHGIPRMLLGSDGSDHYEIYVDSEGVLRVRSADGDKIEGFESIVEEAVVNLSLAAGANSLNGTPVPAGKVWKITQASVLYSGTMTGVTLRLNVEGLAEGIGLLYIQPSVSGVFHPWTGEAYLQEGDYLKLAVGGATLNDDANMKYAGVQMNAP